MSVPRIMVDVLMTVTTPLVVLTAPAEMAMSWLMMKGTAQVRSYMNQYVEYIY